MCVHTHARITNQPRVESHIKKIKKMNTNQFDSEDDGEGTEDSDDRNFIDNEGEEEEVESEEDDEVEYSEDEDDEGGYGDDYALDPYEVVKRECVLGNLSAVRAYVQIVTRDIQPGNHFFYAALIQTAAIYGHLDIVKYLVSVGAEVADIKDRILREICGNGHLDVLKFVYSVRPEIFKTDDQLMNMACFRSHLNVIKFFIEIGMDITKSNHSALLYACLSSNDYIARYLLSMGPITYKRFGNHGVNMRIAGIMFYAVSNCVLFCEVMNQATIPPGLDREISEFICPLESVLIQSVKVGMDKVAKDPQREKKRIIERHKAYKQTASVFERRIAYS